MTQYIKGNKGHNKKDYVLIRQWDNASEIITTPPLTLNQAIKGQLYFEGGGYKLLKIERVNND